MAFSFNVNGEWTFNMKLIIVSLAMMTLALEVKGDECGTKFTDISSSAVLAQAIVKGSIRAFNPIPSRSQTHSANLTVNAVYKGDSVVTAAKRDDVIVVKEFGSEDRDSCVVSSAVISPDTEHIFFLRQTSNQGEMQMTAFPLMSNATVVRRVRRSLCPTCTRPPTIRRLVCKDCAKAPVIKKMKSRKVKMGRRARLRCLARAKPNAKFSWTKNGVPIVSGSGGITIRTTAKSSSLHIRNTMAAHAGEYMCKAENEVGEMVSNVRLELTQRPLRRRRLNRRQKIVPPTSPQAASNTVNNNTDSENQRQTDRVATSEINNEIESQSENNRVPLPQVPASASPNSTTATTTTTTSFQQTFTRKPYTDTNLPRNNLDSRIKNTRLKSAFCQDKTYCLNGGKCRLVLKLDVKFCKCRTGFGGKRCEIKL